MFVFFALAFVSVACTPRVSDTPKQSAPPKSDIPRPPEGTTYYIVQDIDAGFAAHGRVKPGDIVLKINGEPIYFRYAGQVRHWLPAVVNEIGAQPIILTLLRDEREVEMELRARVDPEVTDEDGTARYRLGLVLDYVDHLPMHTPRSWL